MKYPLLLLTPLLGCAATYRLTYGAGAVTKEFVTQAQNSYSIEFNRRADLCHPVTNPTSMVRTFEEFEKCMGEFFSKEDVDNVAAAVSVYKAAALVMTAVLSSPNPSQEELLDAWNTMYSAACDVLREMPGGQEKIDKLNSILGRAATRLGK